MQQWVTQHKIPDNNNPVKAGLWLHQLSKAATRTISIIVNPGKFSMKPGFSPTGLIISKTINTLSRIRRAIRTAEWNAASQIARTVKSLNQLKKAQQQIIQHTPSDSPAHGDILKFLADPLYQIIHPPTCSLPDTIAQIDIALPKLRRYLHGSIRRGLRLASSKKNENNLRSRRRWQD